MSTAIKIPVDRANRLAIDLEEFPLNECGPSDDPDKQTAYIHGFLDLAIRFIEAIKRIGDRTLTEQVANLNVDITHIAEAYLLKAKLCSVSDALDEFTARYESGTHSVNSDLFLSDRLLMELRTISSRKFDLRKLIRFCEELNDSYSRENYLSAIMLLRAIMNHTPPLFGHTTFTQVVAHANRSSKGILEQLHDARPIGDLHNHMTIRQFEPLPTKAQIEPYKPGFEIFISEVMFALKAVTN